MNGHAGKLATLIWLFAGCCMSLQAQQSMQRIPGQQDYPGLDIQAAVGWEDLSCALHPLAISLWISNSSTNVLEGQVVLRNPQTGETRPLGEVAVGPGGTRQFGTVAALGGWDTCELLWEGTDAVLWARQLVIPAEPGAATALNTHPGLFVEDSRRRFILPPRQALTRSAQLDRLSGTSTEPASETDFATRSGALELATIPPWQLPVHPGPLTAVRTVLLSPQLSAERISDVQYRALARWVALGGVVLLAEESEEMLERLREHLPLQPRPAALQDGLTIHHCGQGSIRQFAAAELGQEDSAVTSAAGEMIAAAVSSPLFAQLRQHSAAQVRDPQSTDLRNAAMLTLFGLYAVAAALPILMFRSPRRRQISWVVGVVLTTSVGAAVLGFAIRSSRGDVSLQTLSWIGEGCLVQTATIGLKNAGSGDLYQGVRGREPELQVNASLVEDDVLFAGMLGTFGPFGWADPAGRPAWPPFNLTNSTSADPALSRISVPLSPWTMRKVTGVDMMPLEGRLQVVLEVVGNEGDDAVEKWNQVASFPNCQLRVRLRNSLPFRFRECRLGMILWQRPASPDAEWMLYRTMTDLPQPPLEPASGDAEAEIATEFNPGFEWIVDHGGLNPEFLEISSMVPRGEMEVWVEGRLEESPLMRLEGDDFRESVPAEHRFYYRVPRENLPQLWREMQEWKTPARNN